jgi:hypothetical protein
MSIFSVGLERTLARLAKTGARVCVVLDVPELKFPIPHALLTARLRGLDEGFLTLTRAEAVAGQAAVERDIRALAARLSRRHRRSQGHALCLGALRDRRRQDVLLQGHQPSHLVGRRTCDANHRRMLHFA